MVGSLPPSIGSPSASVIGTRTLGSSRVRPVTLFCSMTRRLTSAHWGPPLAGPPFEGSPLEQPAPTISAASAARRRLEAEQAIEGEESHHVVVHRTDLAKVRIRGVQL